MISPILVIFGLLLGSLLAIFAFIFIGVPVLKAIGSALVAVLRGIGWLLAHVTEFVVGMLRDSVRLVGALIATIVFIPAMAGSVVVGRWSAAGHFASSITRELRIGGACLFRVLLKRPLRLVLLDGLLEGIEQRVPEALAEAPGADRPNRRIGQFDGYTIVGSLRPGGSGAKLYVAEPAPELRSRRPGMPAQVVIKSFAITDGSSLPQIVRESRALDAARQLGLIVDHGLDEHRFFYVMPYHEGDSLGVVTRQLHGESEGSGLTGVPLRRGLGYVVDLVETLQQYHRGGLWHKDVKPENIMVHAGRAHLVDLGLVTPLRSAMTLTTHGTEYFRDPEMVRLALRGVKVHQVDGAKFDVYACGAVLYFVLENTFPAHGGLSSFSKRSPESLRWIIRRAMAEYGKRYQNADQLLADLRYVASAGDPFSVRPADLPSLRGGSFLPESESIASDDAGASSPSFAEGRRSPIPPHPPGPGRLATHPGGSGSAVGTAAEGGGSPSVEVTNWWTGAYRVAGSGLPSAVAAVAAGSVVPPRPPRAAWAPPSAPAAASTPSTPGVRASAALQRRSARQRSERRRHAAAQHVAARLHRPAVPGAALVMLTLLVIGAIVGGAFLATSFVQESRQGALAHAQAIEAATQRHHAVARDAAVAARFASTARPAPASPAPPESPASSGSVASVAAAGAYPAPGLRTLLVNAHVDPAAPATIAAVDRAVADQERAGRSVCRDDVDAIARLFLLMPRWSEGDQAADEAIEELLEERGYASILWITGGRDDRSAVSVQLVDAERAGANQRIGACGE